jgi:hypothetical protein
MSLTDQVKKAQIKNILEKLKAGKTITKREQSQVEAYEKGQETPKTTRELASHYGVSHVAIIKWGKAGCPLTSIEEIDAWRAKQKTEDQPKNLSNAKLRKTLLECERLDVMVKRETRELISRSEVYENGVKNGAMLSAEIRAAASDLRSQLVGLPDENAVGVVLDKRLNQVLANFKARLLVKNE